MRPRRPDLKAIFDMQEGVVAMERERLDGYPYSPLISRTRRTITLLTLITHDMMIRYDTI